RVFVVKVIRKIGDCAVPRFLREPANGFASVTLGSSVQNDERRNQGLWWRYSGGGENLLQLAGANHRVNLGDVLLDLSPVALDQAAGDNQLLRSPGSLVLRHLQDRVHRFLLG